MLSFSGLVSELVSFVLEKGDQDFQVESRNDEGGDKDSQVESKNDEGGDKDSQVESKNDEGSKRERERERNIICNITSTTVSVGDGVLHECFCLLRHLAANNFSVSIHLQYMYMLLLCSP